MFPKYDNPFKIRWWKHLFQIITRGFDDSVTWNLDASLASLIYPRLKRFKEVNICYPPSMTSKEWDNVLDKIIFAFKIIKDDDFWDKDAKIRELNYRAVEEGLKLFSENFRHLWW